MSPPCHQALGGGGGWGNRGNKSSMAARRREALPKISLACGGHMPVDGHSDGIVTGHRKEQWGHVLPPLGTHARPALCFRAVTLSRDANPQAAMAGDNAAATSLGCRAGAGVGLVGPCCGMVTPRGHPDHPLAAVHGRQCPTPLSLVLPRWHPWAGAQQERATGGPLPCGGHRWLWVTTALCGHHGGGGGGAGPVASTVPLLSFRPTRLSPSVRLSLFFCPPFFTSFLSSVHPPFHRCVHPAFLPCFLPSVCLSFHPSFLPSFHPLPLSVLPSSPFLRLSVLLSVLSYFLLSVPPLVSLLHSIPFLLPSVLSSSHPSFCPSLLSVCPSLFSRSSFCPSPVS